MQSITYIIDVRNWPPVQCKKQNMIRGAVGYSSALTQSVVCGNAVLQVGDAFLAAAGVNTSASGIACGDSTA